MSSVAAAQCAAAGETVVVDLAATRSLCQQARNSVNRISLAFVLVTLGVFCYFVTCCWCLVLNVFVCSADVLRIVGALGPNEHGKTSITIWVQDEYVWGVVLLMPFLWVYDAKNTHPICQYIENITITDRTCNLTAFFQGNRNREQTAMFFDAYNRHFNLTAVLATDRFVTVKSKTNQTVVLGNRTVCKKKKT